MSGAVSGRRVDRGRRLESVLDLMRTREDELGAMVHVDVDGARAAVGAARQGPLAGEIVVVKDNIAVRGAPWSAGSSTRHLGRAPSDALAVDRLRSAGAVVLGTTNLDELAIGASTTSSMWGPTRNPHDPTRTSGGSSGGSAAAVAAYGVLAVGTDTGGSIREPAAMCGVVGVAPSPGTVPVDGVVPFAPSHDRVGPLGPDVASTAALHDVLAATGTGMTDAAERGRSRGVDGLTVGLVVPMSGDRNETAVRDGLDRAIRALEELGARIVEVTVPRFGDLLDLYLALTSVEALPTLDSHARRGPLGVEATRRQQRGYQLVDTLTHASLAAVRERVAVDVAATFGSCDVMLSPTTPVVAPPLGLEGVDDPLASPRTDWWTVEANLARLPAMSLPAGPLAEGGLPVGVQLMAPERGDARLYAVGAALEAAMARGIRRAPTRRRGASGSPPR